MKTKVVFILEGNVNGEQFKMTGDGFGCNQEGSLRLNIKADPSYPKNFDPISCPNICSHPTSSYFSRAQEKGVDLPTIMGNEYEVNPARVGRIYDSQGNELLNLKVTSEIKIKNKILYSIHKMTGFSKLPDLERNITPNTDYILPFEAGSATGIVRYILETKDGCFLQGITTIPYKWKNENIMGFPLYRKVEKIDAAWNGSNEASFYYKTSIGRLEAAKANMLSSSIKTNINNEKVYLDNFSLLVN